MKLNINLLVNLADSAREAIAMHYGDDGLAPHAVCKRELLGVAELAVGDHLAALMRDKLQVDIAHAQQQITDLSPTLQLSEPDDLSEASSEA